eukprot:maker-scaffold_147-snap-gene-0.1-mRNA-1 protein AED:0.80 eAED:1.00 QI:0/0/0/1/0/0/2/0/184
MKLFGLFGPSFTSDNTISITISLFFQSSFHLSLTVLVFYWFSINIYTWKWFTFLLGYDTRTVRAFCHDFHMLRLYIRVRSLKLWYLHSTIPLQDLKFDIIPFHSPLLGESFLVYCPSLIYMLKFRVCSFAGEEQNIYCYIQICLQQSSSEHRLWIIMWRHSPANSAEAEKLRSKTNSSQKSQII